MTLLEITAIYLGGIILGTFSICTGKGDEVKTKQRPWIGWLLTTLGWPLLLPFSFYALLGNISFLFGVRLPGMNVKQ